MLKGILKINGVSQLGKQQQSQISGGRASNCPTYTVEQCTSCGGGPLPNGCCRGNTETLLCLTQF